VLEASEFAWITRTGPGTKFGDILQVYFSIVPGLQWIGTKRNGLWPDERRTLHVHA
jgi:hypothetical protein